MTPNPREILVIVEADELEPLFHEIFTEDGSAVTTLRCGEVTLDRLKLSQPDLVLLDCFAQDPARGWVILEMLMVDPDLSLLPTIVSVTPAQAAREMGAHFDAMGIFKLLKPFDRETLLDVINQAHRSRPEVTQATSDTEAESGTRAASVDIR